MARIRKAYDIFDWAAKFEITYLLKRGYLTPGSGVNHLWVSWERSGAVSIDVDPDEKWIRFRHHSSYRAENYVIRLATCQSNLGKGRIWYFVCPETGKRCRKLYLIDGKFGSRYANPHARYCSQTEPKGERGFRKFLTLYGTLDNPKTEWDHYDPQHFRTTYKGKPTKRYQAYLERSERLNALVKLGVLKPRIKFKHSIEEINEWLGIPTKKP
ncbi:MAG TPA: hypothetical protein PKE66_01150 [Pyrinomonadaceae bacterium]|nr:hypothetical protein [Pyrinomonadaceae bacterium]